MNKGEISDLKMKIVERDECIRGLVKKINQIEKCVKTLQQNNNSNTGENTMIRENLQNVNIQLKGK